MTKFSVKKPFTVLVGMVLVLVLGVVSFLGLNTDLLPTIELPYVVVMTTYPGASPEKVETTVTKPLEQAVATVSGLENVQSVSSENMSIVILEFSESSNMDSIMLDLNNNIEMVKGYFDDMVQPPMILKLNPNMLPIQMLSVDVDGKDIKELTEYVENEFKPYLERIDGVATVDVTGAVADYIEISLDQVKIDAINDSILKAIDNTLYETKIDLNSAKSEIANGKADLTTQRDEAFQKFADASSELDAGQAQLQSIVADKTRYDAQIGLIQGQQQALDGKKQLVDGRNQAMAGRNQIVDGINQATAGKEQMLAAKPQLESGIAGINQSITAINGVVASGVPSDVPLSMLVAADTTGMLQGLIDSGVATPEDTLTSLLANLNAQLTALNAQLAEINTQLPILEKTIADLQVQLAEIDKAIAEMDKAIAQIDSQLKEMGVAQEVIDASNSSLLAPKLEEAQQNSKQAEFLAKQMQETVKQLQTAYAEMEKLKLTTVQALAVAESQLISAESQLETGLKEFENARDEALNNANINALVSQSTISSILTAQNFSMPSGYLDNGENTDKIPVKVGDKFSNISDLENLLLLDMGLDDVEPIYLKDVASVEIKDNSEDSFTRINGNPGVTLSIQKSSVASTSQVTKAINQATEKLMLDNPEVHVTTLMDQGVYISMVVNSVLQNLLYGGIIAFFLILLFLKDLKPTIIIAFSIPISLLFSVVLMYFTGVNLNIISLSGLALGVGMLVDNSIVVIENIYRLRNLGYSKVKAAVVGAKQVGGAIFASTLTTVCVFLPIVFTQGISRQLFTDMGLTIAYSLFASLIVALTVVPSLASTLLTKGDEKEHKLFDKLVNSYAKVLEFNLKHKWIVVCGTLGLLILSLYNASKMPLELIPAMDSNQMQMTYTVEKDTDKDEMLRNAQIIGDRVAEIEGVATVGLSHSTGGGSGLMAMASASGENSVSYYVLLDDENPVSSDIVVENIKEATTEFKDELSISTSNMDISTLGGSGISIVLKGNDLDVLAQTASDIKSQMETIEGVKSVSDGSADAVEEMRIDVNKEKAMKHNLMVAQVFQKVSESLVEETKSTTMSFNNKELDTIIIPATKQTSSSIGDIVVATEVQNKGEDDEKEVDILLKDIATIYDAKTPSSINRDNQSRTQTITATLEDGYNVGLVGREIQDTFKDYEVPAGYSLEFTGENETITSTMIDLMLMIGLAIIFIYLIMVAQFQSLLSPFIVLFTIPLAFTGGLLALQITGQSLSITSMIGFLVLAGVVVNNGIVFVDYVNQQRLDGVDKTTALIQTGKDRIRPILMTALTTILAMSTMALGVGMGAQMSQGMAIVTIGGLAYATILTLLLVPALYDIMHKKEVKAIDVDFEE